MSLKKGSKRHCCVGELVWTAVLLRTVTHFVWLKLFQWKENEGWKGSVYFMNLEIPVLLSPPWTESVDFLDSRPYHTRKRRCSYVAISGDWHLQETPILVVTTPQRPLPPHTPLRTLLVCRAALWTPSCCSISCVSESFVGHQPYTGRPPGQRAGLTPNSH